jgi:hypothetical protein
LNLQEWFNEMNFSTLEKQNYKSILIKFGFDDIDVARAITIEHLVKELPLGHCKRIFLSKEMIQKGYRVQFSLLQGPCDINFTPTISSTGKPLFLFEENFQPTCTVHGAVFQAVGNAWDDTICDEAKLIVEDKLQTSTVKDVMSVHKLTEDEAGAIIYWTVSGSRNLHKDEKISIYSLLNKSLLTRTEELVKSWKPFLFYLLEGLKKMPTFTGPVYRGVSEKLSQKSNQYFVGNKIIWITGTSTSKKSEVRKSFAGGASQTWIIIDVKNGKSIESLSMFPGEEEVLLPPNTHLVVKENNITPKMRELIEFPPNCDVLYLEQLDV